MGLLKTATLLIRKGIPFYGTNPDKTFPTPEGMETGYNIQLSGKAKTGDTFVIEFNTDAVGNNVNALELGELQIIAL